VCSMSYMRERDFTLESISSPCRLQDYETPRKGARNPHIERETQSRLQATLSYVLVSEVTKNKLGSESSNNPQIDMPRLLDGRASTVHMEGHMNKNRAILREPVCSQKSV
jgi:hypothetical protein